MEMINYYEARDSFSHLITRIENEDETAFAITINGKPVAMLIPYKDKTTKTRIGTAKGMFTLPDDLDKYNEKIEELFETSL